MKIVKLTMILLICFSAIPAALIAAEADYLSVSSVGRHAKLTFVNDFLIPANKTTVNLRESGRGDASVVSTCTVEMTESSLDARVLKSGAQIIFTGEAEESEAGEWKIHVLKVEQPEAIKSVACQAMRIDNHFKWHPTLVIIWDLKAAFSGFAKLTMPEPVEIPTP